jgi:transcription elongation GreA/GreB family factor
MATTLTPTAREAGVYLTESDFAALMDELEWLRGAVAARAGSLVRVRDRRGRTTEYELIEQAEPADAREKVTVGSPLGQALIGARPGDFINLVAGNGRRRRVRVLDVRPAG